MREAFGSAILAGNGIDRKQCVMRAATVAAALGVLALWMWGHFLLSPLYIHQTGMSARLFGFA